MKLENIDSMFISYGIKIVMTVIILVVGLWIIKKIMRFITRKFEKVGFDKSLRTFSLSLIKITLQILLIITIISMLGAPMSSFVAIIGSAGLAIGLALQGSLSNFAGGVLILVLKPFKTGDYIEAAGQSGTVEEIQVFYTILNTPDNKRVIIPNSNLSNSNTINYSSNPTRRVDFKFGVGYEEEIFKVKDILHKIAIENPLIFKDPAPQIVLGEHGNNAIVFYLRVWCKTEDYWNIYFDTLEKTKIEFDKAKVNIPYPQMDVHLFNKN